MGFRMELVQGATPICQGSCRLTSLERQECGDDCRVCKVRVGRMVNLVVGSVDCLVGRKDNRGLSSWSNRSVDQKSVSIKFIPSHCVDKEMNLEIEAVQNCSKQCLESFKTLQKNYDSEREKHSRARLEIQGHELALESLESRILRHEKNELAWGEKYEFQNYELKCIELKIYNLNMELEKVVKEIDELNIKIAKWEESSKSINILLNSQMSAHDKNGLGYGTQMDEMSNKSKTDSEISMSVFEVRSSDEELTPANDRFSKADGYHVVPPPITGNFLTPRSDISFAGLDEYAIRKKIIESKTDTSKSKTSETDWNSDDENDVSEVSPVKTNETQTTKTQVDKIGQTSKEAVIGFKKIKACFALWDNAKRTNGKRAVHTVSTASPISTARPFAPKLAQTGSAIRPIYPIIDNASRRSCLQDQQWWIVGCSSIYDWKQSHLSDYEDYNKASWLLEVIQRRYVQQPSSFVKQQPEGIFFSQDKYVADIIKKFDFCSIKTATTPIESNKPLVPQNQPKLGLWYPRDSPCELEAFSYSDYRGASLDRKSTTGGCQFLGRRLISWQCKKQTIVANSTTEAEYVAAANFKNPVYHSRTKHIEIRHHFIRDCYEKRLIDVVKIHTDNNIVDFLTKGFDVTRFNFLVVSIGMLNLLVPSCFMIYDLELLSLSFNFVFSPRIIKSFILRLDLLCHLEILCLDQYAHTLHHLESLLTNPYKKKELISIKEDLVISGHEHVEMNPTYIWNKQTPSPNIIIQRISLTGFPAQKRKELLTKMLSDSPCLARSSLPKHLKATTR
ncbi:hypothetical protein Tco_0601719 [Tanacetum coccineum]